MKNPIEVSGFSLFTKVPLITLALVFFTGCFPTATHIPPTRTGAGTSAGDSGGGNNGINGPVSQAREYYNRTVVPMFEQNCKTCHNEPRFGGDGPLTIYNYDRMVSRVRTGTSPEDSELILYVQNQIPHTGGDRCQGNSENSPCSEIKTWWTKEVAEGNGPTATTPFGRVAEITLEGVYGGWCLDADFPDQSTTVEFYLDLPKGNGNSPIATVRADLPYAGINYPGNHGFRFSIPQANRDKLPHSLYVYCMDLRGNPEGNLTKTAKRFQLYPFTTAGRNYFNNTLRNDLTGRCNTCHAVASDPIYQYEYAFTYLIGNPTPAKGGSATNNRFINYASGINHTGGNLCGNLNSAPCSLMQTWWNTEFNTP